MMLVAMFIFALMAMKYKYVETETTPGQSEELKNLTKSSLNKEVYICRALKLYSRNKFEVIFIVPVVLLCHL